MKKILCPLGRILLSVVFLCSTQLLLAQSHACGTASPTEADRQYFLEQIRRLPILKTAGTTGVAIKIHSVRTDAGGGGIDNGTLALALANLNSTFADAAIEFYYLEEPSFANSTALFDFNENEGETESDVTGLFTTAFNAVNIYVVNSITLNGGFQAAGYAYFPWDSPSSNIVFMTRSAMGGAPNGTLSHEFGHYFSVYHTFESTQNGTTAPETEHVARFGANKNCEAAGDYLCDTPADPNAGNVESDCSITGSGNDRFGDPYTPDVDNIMSYYPDGCGGRFTNDQYDVINQGLGARLGHSTYSIQGAPMNVTSPTNIACNFDAAYSTVDISWSGASNDVMGYILERSSTSSTTGFLPITEADLDYNMTTYRDLDVMSNTTYWYRVKAINGDKDNYSPVCQVDVGLIFCSVLSTQTTCGSQDEYVANVRIGSIDNPSGCTTEGLESYIDQVTTVSRGVDYDIEVQNGTNLWPDDQCSIFVDWNQDGDFEDADEEINVDGSPGRGPYNATISVPNNAPFGTCRMRVRVGYGAAPQSCGVLAWSEAEDYTLDVVAALPVEWLSFTASYQRPTVKLEWATTIENNNKAFAVERSNGNGSYKTIGQIAGKGTTQQTSSYSFIDPTPALGLNYYRLQQIDFDGSTEYSKIVRIMHDASDVIAVYPNPTTAQIHLQLPSDIPQDIEIRVRDQLGRLIEVPITANSTRQWQLDVSSLHPGIYTTEITTTQGDRWSKRFSKL